VLASGGKEKNMKSNIAEGFQEIREQNIMKVKEAKEQGQKMVGLYCTYCPKELVLAAGAIAVGLCGTREEPIAFAEKHLPRNLCPLIKSSYGFAVSDTCPYFHFSDLIIGETTCDGKKKMFELMADLKETVVMNLPQNPLQEASLELWASELRRVKELLEERFQTELSDEKIRAAINLTNREARVMKRLYDLNKARPALISGLDMLTVSWQVGVNVDREEGIGMLEDLITRVQENAAQGGTAGDAATPRILLTGTPVGLGSEKIIALVEESGGLVVVMENCGGYKTVDILADESDQRDPLRVLAEKYMKIPCSVMSPNRGRLELIDKMIDEFQIDGVIDLTWQACHTYNIESFWVSDLVKQKGLPFLQIETDYSASDRETLRVRIEAFLEMVK
jgi:benzoyl-CoA reductase/2-hydroxyglutaryl-CoA dehydratase subunit BcrC/BadD/HgdB